MKVFAVEVFRTDTNKEGYKIVRLFKTKESAKQCSDKLNSLEESDDYSVYRYCVSEKIVEE